MTYEHRIGGRVANGASDCGKDGFWTFDAVEERLIEAMRLWWRSPGGGRWPFASDAPWHLMTRVQPTILRPSRSRIGGANDGKAEGAAAAVVICRRSIASGA
jgi:hypothetical protein